MFGHYFSFQFVFPKEFININIFTIFNKKLINDQKYCFHTFILRFNSQNYEN